MVQTVDALVEATGRDTARRVLDCVGRGDLLTRRPEAMVDEREFTALIGTLRRELGPELSASILASAGERTVPPEHFDYPSQLSPPDRERF